MKIRIALLAAALILPLISSVSTAADPVEPSKISGYVGAYRGSINFAAMATGTTRASFTGSRGQEIGTLRLTSVVGGTTTVSEVVSIRKNRVLYNIQPGSGTTFYGRGPASVTARVIRYTATVDSNGTPVVVRGTIRKSSNRLSVVHTLSGPTSAVISYALRKVGN